MVFNEGAFVDLSLVSTGSMSNVVPIHNVKGITSLDLFADTPGAADSRRSGIQPVAVITAAVRVLLGSFTVIFLAYTFRQLAKMRVMLESTRH